jgi:nickel-dependent lactate racemase
MKEVELRTGIWYNDRSLIMNFPDAWDVVTYWPDASTPLIDEDLREKINSPIGQPALRELAKGKASPVIIVDDLARPTPVFRIMPFLLEQFRLACVPRSNIRILVATGTHGPQNEEALVHKIGKEAMESCQVIIHDDQKHTKFLGKTSFGTPVHVNRELLKSDLIVGVGGVYPQHTVGFGGGSKLVLGILGRKSIMHLHYSHESVGGNYNIDNDFRKDVTEIARMVGLNTMYTLHVNAHLQVVSLMCGDHFAYYPRAAELSRQGYSAPLPEDADVVIANAYPFDTSFTFMRKGYRPLDCAPENATRIMIASNHEGIGTHGLFQHMKPPRFLAYRMLYRRISVMEPHVIISKIFKHLMFRKSTSTKELQHNYALPVNTNQVWVYRPVSEAEALPSVEGMTVTSKWDEILEAIVREQSSRGATIRVRIYPCAPLQCLDIPAGTAQESLE